MKLRPRLDTLTKSISEKIAMALEAMGYGDAVFNLVILNPEDGETIVSGNVEVEGSRRLLEEALRAVPEEKKGEEASPVNGPIH